MYNSSSEGPKIYVIKLKYSRRHSKNKRQNGEIRISTSMIDLHPTTNQKLYDQKKSFFPNGYNKYILNNSESEKTVTCINSSPKLDELLLSTTSKNVPLFQQSTSSLNNNTKSL